MCRVKIAWAWMVAVIAQISLGCGIDPVTEGPPAGNPEGTCPVPPEAQAEDTAMHSFVVGTGTPESCTSDAFIEAVAKGGVITFNCGPAPVTITLDRTAKVFNNTGSKIVIDGEGKVALSGGGKFRILYQNTCDPAQTVTTPKCESQETPQLTVQNLTFFDGNSTDQDSLGGGAIFVSGGRFKAINCRFFRNVGDAGDWMAGGGAIRTLNQYNRQPVYIVHSTFGGENRLGNSGINGGALSGVEVSYTVLNSVLSYNQANASTTGAGGAIYTLSGDMLSLCGVRMTNNKATGPGGALFFGGDSTATLSISNSVLSNNQNDTETAGYPGILARGNVKVETSTIE